MNVLVSCEIHYIILQNVLFTIIPLDFHGSRLSTTCFAEPLNRVCNRLQYTQGQRYGTRVRERFEHVRSFLDDFLLFILCKVFKDEYMSGGECTMKVDNEYSALDSWSSPIIHLHGGQV